ncbi:MAG: hypothetical protein NTY93_00550 [Candidatus Kaiserbacteria bacterium]|nr:hypothetical protein [Candidatus Kaiserbacteria bacterium]
MKSHFFNLIIVFISVLAVLIGYGFWYAAVAAKSATVAGLQNQIATETETASRIATARAVITEIAGDEAVVQSYFVPETGVVRFISELEAQGQAQGATTSVLSVSTGTGTQPTLLFSLSVKGTFDAVLRAVGVIEYMPYNLSVSGLSLTQDDKNSWNANLDLVVGSVKATTNIP